MLASALRAIDAGARADEATANGAPAAAAGAAAGGKRAWVGHILFDVPLHFVRILLTI